MKTRSILSLLGIALLLAAGCKPAAPADNPFAAADAYEKRLKEQATLKRDVGTNGLTREDVRNALWRLGITNSVSSAADDVYVGVERSWLLSDFSMRLKKRLFELNLAGVANNRFDCDDFSDGAAFFAQVDARVELKAPAGLAFGVLYYHRENPAGRHAINFSVLRDGSVLFYEPQTQMPVTLSAEERSSVNFWRL